MIIIITRNVAIRVDKIEREAFYSFLPFKHCHPPEKVLKGEVLM